MSRRSSRARWLPSLPMRLMLRRCSPVSELPPKTLGMPGKWSRPSATTTCSKDLPSRLTRPTCQCAPVLPCSLMHTVRLGRHSRLQRRLGPTCAPRFAKFHNTLRLGAAADLGDSPVRKPCGLCHGLSRSRLSWRCGKARLPLRNRPRYGCRASRAALRVRRTPRPAG